MSVRHFLALLLLSALATAPALAQAAPPLVNPVMLTLGGPAVHLTPHAYNASGTEVPVTIQQCTIGSLPAAIASVTYDATGALLTAVGTGSATLVQWTCTNGSASVSSGPFAVTVPWSVTAIGDTSP